MRRKKVKFKKYAAKFTSIVLAIIFLVTVSPIIGYASLDNPTEPDVIVAKTEGSLKLHFPDIVNVPAEVYNGAYPNGKLLVAYYKNTVHAPTSSSQPFGEIWMVESTDNGQTWSEERLIMSSEILIQKGICTSDVPIEARDPNFALLNDGTVILTFFTRRYTTDNYIKVYMMESKDGGDTWSDPELIPCETLNNWCAKRGNIAVFDDDEILVPVYGGGTEYPQETAVNILGKRNENDEWEWVRESVLATTPELGTRINEVSLIATGGDTVYALAREPGYLWKSEDRGITWERCGEQGALHQPGLIKVDHNRVFCTWSRPSSPRPIYGKMFYLDQGWDATAEKLIYRYPYGGTDMGDPSAVLTNDGKLLTIYYVTALQIIGGTFSDPDDWAPYELSSNGDKWKLFEDNFEDDTEDAAYANPYFTYNVSENKTITVKSESDNKYIQFYSKFTSAYQMPEMISKDTISGDYTAQFDFRFNEKTPDDGTKLQEMYVAMQQDAGVFIIHLRPEALLLKIAKGEEVLNIENELSIGSWYTFKSVRCGKTIYVKVWEKGTPEPDEWNMIYSNPGINSAAGKFRMAYLTSSTSGQSIDVDNLILSKQVEMKLSETTLERVQGSPPVKLNAILTPAQPDAPIIWTTSDATVATVENGLVRFIGQGTATITALLGGIARTCTVNVLEAPFEFSKEGDQWIFFAEDFEDDTPDAAYTNKSFNLTVGENNTLTVKKEGDNNYLQLFSKYTTGYNMPQLRTVATTSDDYTAQFDFRFNGRTHSGAANPQEMYISMQHSSGSYVIHLRDDGIVFKHSGTVVGDITKDHEPGDWFTFKSTRINGGIYIKTWPKGSPEPDNWDLSYNTEGLTSIATVYRMAFITSSTDGQVMDIDNLTLSKRTDMKLSSTEINAKNTDEPVQLTVTFEPDITAQLPVSNVVWSSDNNSVAVVDNNGLVEFVGAGNATITATLDNITKSCFVTVEEDERSYILSIGDEMAGGAGHTRTITVSGGKADDLTGKYLVVQFTEGTGVNAKVSVVMISSVSKEVIVSYQESGTQVEAWLTNGMPDLVGKDMGVAVYANASTN